MIKCLLLIVTINCRVAVFHLKSQFSHVIGSRQFDNPWSVVVTSNDQLLVADYDNDYIFRFTFDGTYVDRFGNDYLSLPTALTCDLSDFVLVSDEDHNSVSVFDKDGVFLHRFGSHMVQLKVNLHLHME